MEEEATVNSSELLELCSGLRAKDDENGLMEDSDYRKGEDCLCKHLSRVCRFPHPRIASAPMLLFPFFYEFKNA